MERTVTKLYEMTVDWMKGAEGKDTEVAQYTVSVTFCEESGGKTYSYLAIKGEWEKGDIVVVVNDSKLSTYPQTSLATVTAVDTKTPTSKWLVGLKFKVTYIKSGE